MVQSEGASRSQEGEAKPHLRVPDRQVRESVRKDMESHAAF